MHEGLERNRHVLVNRHVIDHQALGPGNRLQNVACRKQHLDLLVDEAVREVDERLLHKLHRPILNGDEIPVRLLDVDFAPNVPGANRLLNVRSAQKLARGDVRPALGVASKTGGVGPYPKGGVVVGELRPPWKVIRWRTLVW